MFIKRVVLFYIILETVIIPLRTQKNSLAKLIFKINAVICINASFIQDLCLPSSGRVSVRLTISLKAFSMAPTTRLSCLIFFSMKNRGAIVLGDPGAPAAPLSEAALDSPRWEQPADGWRWCTGFSSPRQVGGWSNGFCRISSTSWSCSSMWRWRNLAAKTAAPEPPWPSNRPQ